MAGGLLDDFLADVGAKDEYLRKSSKDNVAAPELPPVRGSAGILNSGPGTSAASPSRLVPSTAPHVIAGDSPPAPGIGEGDGSTIE